MTKYKEWNSGKEVNIFNICKFEYNNKDLYEKCELIMQNNIFLNNKYKLVKFDQKKNLWKMNPFKDRTWCFKLHSFFHVEYLVNGYKKSGDKKYIVKAMWFFENWMEKNIDSETAEMAWHDHATALRLIIICNLYENWRKECWNITKVKLFESAINTHSSKLADENFYMEKHNHGLDQDIALLVASYTFSEIPDILKLRKLAIERMWMQINELIGIDGSYLEHSPEYANLICNRLIDLFEFLRDCDNKTYKRLEIILTNLVNFIKDILQPNGFLPSIGDSEEKPLNINKLKKLNYPSVKALEYLVSKGLTGQVPENLDSIYPDGGYAILRNSWDYNSDTVQTVFYSSFHSRVHKHKDDLSINIYGYGQPILVDAGKYNYNYKSEGRKFVESTRAHNTVMIDNKDFDTKRLNIGHSGLIEYNYSAGISYIAAAHNLYKNIIIKRMVLFLKPYSIIIFDYIKGNKAHYCEQVFNFYPNIKCQPSNKDIFGKIKCKKVVLLRSLLDESDLKINLYKGEKNPLNGWYSNSYSSLAPSYSLRFAKKGEISRFATLISFDTKIPTTPISWQDNVIQGSLNGNVFQININSVNNDIFINGKALQAHSIIKPKLEEILLKMEN